MEWNASYVDHLMWILDHLQDLHLDPEETVVLFLIEFANRTGRNITHEWISEKTALDVEKIESVFLRLSDKGYLTTKLENGSLIFDISGVAQENNDGTALGQPLVARFEDAMKRTLSPNEMQRILDMAGAYDERMVICALNEAIVYGKVNLNYIETILVRWQEKGLSPEDVENGKR
ncbi:DnaD domain-containing protein [Catenisphaera adipataccumulans]|uniref:DnaD/phage-associated family protein n=1 Tax=Catenisphaera adipataccumulans TaxID=700500 RepID=A0A7W8CZT9_9FIRM|nr:DnaD domain protein [Catenisphaera adipataccumulans]MBB5183483.1 DnaD/phage-associated family protein [Catenisphaera adipataccumulans]